MLPVLALCIAGATCALLTPLVISWLQKAGTVDIPNERSLHHAQLPRGGGIAIAISVSATVLLVGSLQGVVARLLLIAVALGAVGLLDDRRGVAPVARLAVQVVAGVAVGFAVGLSTGQSLALVVGAVIIMTFGTNAFNFMDGINGIAGIHCSLFSFVIGVELIRVDDNNGAALAFALFGASLTFLPYNFPRARVFLGDVGSYFIGGLLSSLAIYAVASGATVVIIVAVFGYYIVDSSTTILLRLRRGENILAAHRDHMYQRLVRAGHSHVMSTLTATALSVFGLFTALGTSQIVDQPTSLVVVFTVLSVAVALVRRFAVARLVE